MTLIFDLDLCVINGDVHNVMVTWKIKLFRNYFSLRRSPSEIILFQRVETCLQLFQNYYFWGWLQLMNIFHHVQCRRNNFEIIPEVFQRLAYFYFSFKRNKTIKLFYYSAAKKAVYATTKPSVCLSVHLSVRMSVTLRYCVKTREPSGGLVSLVFWRQEWLMGDDHVGVKFECKQIDPLWKQPSCTHLAS